MSATETDIRDQVEQDVPLICDHFIVQISHHDFKASGGDNECQAPAKWIGLVHSVVDHDRRPALLCDEHKDCFMGAHCPNPVCQAPRITDIQPI